MQLRTLFLTIALITISGCSVFGARFDNNEYASFTRLYVQADNAIQYCADPDALRVKIDIISQEAEFLYLYTKHLPKNNETHAIAKILRGNIKELKQAYTNGVKSEGYCRIKLTILTQHVERALAAVGVKVH